MFSGKKYSPDGSLFSPKHVPRLNIQHCPLITRIIIVPVNTLLCARLCAKCYMWLHFILTTDLQGRFYYLFPFTDEKTEHRRGAVTCSRSHSQNAIELGCEPGLSNSILLPSFSLSPPHPRFAQQICL